MKDKGILFWKKRYFSNCNHHQVYKKQCHLCQGGTWKNLWRWKLGQLISKIAPDFWVRWNAEPAIIATPFSPEPERGITIIKISDDEEIILYFTTLFGDDVTIEQVASFNQLQEYCDVHKYTKEFVLNTIKNKLTYNLNDCYAGRDGECNHELCPQLRDGEPEKTGRFCPLPHWSDHEDY